MVKKLLKITSVGASLIIAVGVACSSAPTSYHAQSMALWRHHETLPELVSAADVIVRATVIATDGVYSIGSGSARNLPIYFTNTRIRVDEALKGAPAQELIVWQQGKLDAPGDSFADLPILRPGTSVLLFLGDISSDPVHGKGQTKYGIVSPEGLYGVYGDRLVTAALGRPVTNLADKSGFQAFAALVRQAK